jgi:transcription termination/antitermination protein NusG
MQRHWFTIHTYSGHEKKVATNILRRAQSIDMFGRKIFEVILPTEKESKVRSGRKTEVDRKVYPGYVFVDMILDEQTWHLVRNTIGVIKFVGDPKPTPLKDSEIRQIKDNIENKRPVIRQTWEVGQSVRVAGGPFADLEGTIQEVNAAKDKVKVSINLFGRETSVELELNQIEKNN